MKKLITAICALMMMSFAWAQESSADGAMKADEMVQSTAQLGDNKAVEGAVDDSKKDEAVVGEGTKDGSAPQGGTTSGTK